ncbi:MaoC family dehydratase [Rugamonas apoptosis]|uniref:MaoC family dehydratase n=1 Tax=Rugamonas apoptosis TaxID=2758570 RepID=A0A7W2FDV7_9BURK|nr:MaoC family dehydratase [Rugamonas apoptosis]MBA5689932.1 MaoC family dehydratase [Rugamonas apoptosis]
MTGLVIVGERFSKRHQFNELEARAFAIAAGDTNPLHHDKAIAERSRYGRLIVSGTHTTALLLGLAASHFARNYPVVGRSFTVDFRRPVFMGTQTRIEWEVVAVSMTRGAVQTVALRGGVYDEQGEPCVQATGTVRLGVQLEAPPGALGLRHEGERPA